VKACNSENEWEQQDCLIDVAVNTAETEVCDKIEGQGKNNCIESIAESTDNLELCSTISGDSYWSDICYTHFGEKRADVEICRNIEHEGDKNECFFSIAQDTENFWACEEIYGSDQPRYNQCIFQVSVSSENTETCIYLEDFMDRALCVRKIAESLGDSSVCEQVKVEMVREQCYERLGGVPEAQV
jgi:hypothetical protein